VLSSWHPTPAGGNMWSAYTKRDERCVDFG
jgi:hypothetical protein